MDVKRFAERTGAMLGRGMCIGNYCKRDSGMWTEGSAGKTLFETKVKGSGLPEAGGVLQSPHAVG